MGGLEGRVYRRVQTDLDRWHWENLALPPGIRAGSFRHTEPIEAPVEAVVRLGPAGLEGRLHADPFHQLEDALLSLPGQPRLAVHVDADGTLRAGPEDALATGQFLTSALLNDRQRARRDLYQKLFADPQPRYIAQRRLLFAWAEPLDLHFRLVPGVATRGAALLVVPFQFERTLPGTPVVIPAALVESRRVTEDGRALSVAVEARNVAQLNLRFRLPDAVLPLAIERARLSLELSAPLREVIIRAAAGADTVVLRRRMSPQGTEQIDIDDPRLLQLDDQGTLHVDISIGPPRGRIEGLDTWRLESAGLEIRGKTVPIGRMKDEG
jgi:hypothetical protein